jgi:membrane fusion protein, copper/silver efflux system
MILRNGKGFCWSGISMALGVAGGYWLAQPRVSEVPGQHRSRSRSPQSNAKCCIGTTPCTPQQKFDKPGKSPFMDMQLVPQYADMAKGTAQPFALIQA